jgi:hypothetical protein
MEIGELVSPPSLNQELTAHCPFKEQSESGPAKADEDVADDDRDSAQAPQENDGGLLGKNLSAGKLGVADGGPFPGDDFVWQSSPNDSKRGRKSRVHIPEYRDAKAGDFPFTVAAHHLIPGNAALYNGDVGLLDYMQDGGKVKSASGREYNIKGNIGYDVNGSHNGVWLPGNYAIRAARPERKKAGKTVAARPGTSPIPELSWEALSNEYEPWQFDYVAGTCKAAGGQFHDSHESPYSDSVRKNLMNIVGALAYHFDACEECRKKKEPVPPPFRLKWRLYALSRKLRLYVTGPPGAWTRPWFTSERWSQKYFRGGKLSDEFHRAYMKAKETRPEALGL